MKKWGPLTAALLILASLPANGQVTGDAPGVRPDAIVDLKTDEGIGLVKGQWRYSNARVVDVDHHSPGVDLAPSGPPNRTQDIDLHAGAADFDDSKWEQITPAQLEERRSTGRLCFNWYRTSITIPGKVGSFDPAGSTVVFEIAIDDYAEVWVDGKLPLVLGQPGGQLIKGFNAPNRVVLTKNARPGQKIQLAVFGINGPLSNPPGNFIWVRSATLDFYKSNQIGPTQFVNTEIVRVDPALDVIVSSDTKLEKLAGGFLFTEGPVWVLATADASGHLLFSDPNANTIYRWSPDGQVSVFRTKSGYSGFDIGEYHQPGSNGLTLDSKGRLTINQHGNRRVIRVEPRGNITVLADRYDGKRLNSPNDLVYRSDGALYFTDPPFGLPKVFDDPRKELPYSGVYCGKDAQVKLVSMDLDAPNGLALSPDEKFLYVNNWNDKKKIILRYDVKPDCTLTNRRLFFDMTEAPGSDALDGLVGAEPVSVIITSLDPRFDQFVPKDAKLEKIADGFTWVEGPVWHKQGGYLLFSDIPANAVYKWKQGEGVSVFLTNSGYSGSTPFAGKEPGSNGLTFDANGRLVLCRHGDRQIGRLEADGHIVTLADRYDGRRINSPNDLVFKSNGDLYFTDPPFGLPKAFDDPGKAPVQGVYRLSKDGMVTLLIHDIKAPNGIAFSPDEKTLYVSDVDPKRAAWLAYDVKPDGTVTNGRVFFDATRWRKDPFFGPDGFKVDRQGNIFGARPGGLSVIASDGTLLGTIETGQPTSNVAWGEDEETLFITGGSSVYRLRLTTGAALY